MGRARRANTDVVRVEQEFAMIPGTGELVDLADTAAVAHGLAALREFKQQVADADAALTEALIEESVRQGTKTLHFDTVKVEIRGGRAVEYDAELIEAGLRRAGMPENRIREIVVETVDHRVSAANAKQAASASAAYRKVIEKGSVEVTKRQSVAVKTR